MKSIYINVRISRGRETVDSVDPSPEYWPTARAMRKEAVRLVAEYRLAGMAVYMSSRACKGW